MVMAILLGPPVLVTVSFALKMPGLLYVWLGFWSVLVLPSPKLQEKLVMIPVEAFKNIAISTHARKSGETDAGRYVRISPLLGAIWLDGIELIADRYINVAVPAQSKGRRTAGEGPLLGTGCADPNRPNGQAQPHHGQDTLQSFAASIFLLYSFVTGDDPVNLQF
jgi:hypothetical protein